MRQLIFALVFLAAAQRVGSDSHTDQYLRSYLDERIESLYDIEGIWTKTMSLSVLDNRGIWVSVSPAPTTVAYIKDPSSLDSFLYYVFDDKQQLYVLNSDSEFKLKLTAEVGTYVLTPSGAEVRVLGNRFVQPVDGPTIKGEVKGIKLFPLPHGPRNRVHPRTSLSQGTGFIVSKEGLVVTNFHVIEDSDSVTVAFSGSTGSFSARAVRTDPSNDIAVLQLIEFKSVSSPLVVSTVPAKQGDDVFALGFPLSEQMGIQQAKLTTGVISSDFGFQDNPRLLQVTTTLQPGSSGGPLFDRYGSVVGITAAKLKNAENVNYAVKAAYINALLSTIPDYQALPRALGSAPPALPEVLERVQPLVVLILARRF